MEEVRSSMDSIVTIVATITTGGIMDRKKFLAAIASLPLVGWLVRQSPTAPDVKLDLADVGSYHGKWMAGEWDVPIGPDITVFYDPMYAEHGFLHTSESWTVQIWWVNRDGECQEAFFPEQDDAIEYAEMLRARYGGTVAVKDKDPEDLDVIETEVTQFTSSGPQLVPVRTFVEKWNAAG